MASTFELEIVTPDRRLYEGTVEMVVVRTTTGDLGIKSEHISLVSPLSIGSIKIKESKGKFKEAACGGGFIQVRQDKTTIITDSAEFSEEIDVQRAKEAVERAQTRLMRSSEGIDVLRAQIALKKALNRLRVAKRD
jgi:F-type H+-transporting ATPase subunit epsilon